MSTTNYSDGNDNEIAFRPAYETVQGIVENPTGELDKIPTINNNKYNNTISDDITKTSKDEVEVGKQFKQDLV